MILHRYGYIVMEIRCKSCTIMQELHPITPPQQDKPDRILIQMHLGDGGGHWGEVGRRTGGGGREGGSQILGGKKTKESEVKVIKLGSDAFEWKKKKEDINSETDSWYLMLKLIPNIWCPVSCTQSLNSGKYQDKTLKNRNWKGKAIWLCDTI